MATTWKQDTPDAILGLLVPMKCALPVLVVNGQALKWKIAVFLASVTDRYVVVNVNIS